MLNISTKETEFGKIITISDNIKEFDIFYGGNGDLYFHPLIDGIDLYENNDPIEFIIDECDSEIYPLFNKLYNKIVQYSPYDKDEFMDEMEYDFYNKFDDIEYEKRKDSYRKYPLVHDGIISWHSDEDMQIQSSILNIKKEQEKIILEFIKCNPVSMAYMTYSIRFRNSGSSYDPFNCRFMELYNDLCKIDFNYHQITIQEYINSLNKDKTKILKK